MDCREVAGTGCGNSAKKNKVNRVWFDDVVVATKYIGPPVPPLPVKLD